MKKIGRFFKNIFLGICRFFELIGEHQITVYAAQAAFFMILSAVPLIILIIGIARYVVNMDWLLNIIDYKIEGELGDILASIVKEVINKTGASLVSFTAIAALWSASRGIFAVTRGISGAYGVHIKENFILDIIRSFIYTFVFIFLIVIMLLLLVFAESIIRVARAQLPLLAVVLNVITDSAPAILAVVLTLFFSFIFNTVSRKGRSFSRVGYKELSGKLPRGFFAQLPGAAFAALGWVLFSYFFSLYVRYFPGVSYLYGSLTTLMILMLWIYFCMFILMLGAELNMAVFTRWNIGKRRKEYVQQKKRKKATLARVRTNCSSFKKKKKKDGDIEE